MIEIPLTQGKVALIDDEDLPLVQGYRWNVTDSGYAHTIRSERGRYAGYLRMHRLIVGAKPGELVDHINGNKLDNRRGNLRRCNSNENCWNRSKVRGATSQYKGVSWNPDQSNWKASIYPNGKHLSLGRYHDEKSAAHAYDAAAIKHYGDFARTNFPARSE